MRRVLTLLTLACLLPFSLAASEFDWLVREFSSEIGVQPRKIPFFGLARFIVAVARPAGTSDLHLAIFEHSDISPQLFGTFADAAVAGDGWKPIVRVCERGREATNIYAREDGHEHLRLLIAALNRDDATLVEVRIQPQDLIRFVGEQRKRSGNH